MTFPSVSVLIPCYNRAKYIQRVIQSVQNQTLPPNEIVVVDDASTDDSVAVLKECGVKWLRHPVNRGPAVARNSAFSASSGEIVIFIDSDAYADQHMIENLVKVYRQAADPEHLGGVGGRGLEAFSDSLPDQWRSLHARQDFGKFSLPDIEYLVGLCCSFKRSVFEKVSGFDGFYAINAGEDLDIGLRIRRAGFRLAYTPDAFIHHQHRDTFESLKRVQYNWTYWNFIARKRNHMPTQKIYLGILRRLLVDTFQDLMIQRNPRLAKINLDLFPIKISALQKARLVPVE